jgi:hypothetical protein
MVFERLDHNEQPILLKLYFAWHLERTKTNAGRSRFVRVLQYESTRVRGLFSPAILLLLLRQFCCDCGWRHRGTICQTVEASMQISSSAPSAIQQMFTSNN